MAITKDDIIEINEQRLVDDAGNELPIFHMPLKLIEISKVREAIRELKQKIIINFGIKKLPEDQLDLPVRLRWLLRDIDDAFGEFINAMQTFVQWVVVLVLLLKT